MTKSSIDGDQMKRKNISDTFDGFAWLIVIYAYLWEMVQRISHKHSSQFQHRQRRQDDPRNQLPSKMGRSHQHPARRWSKDQIKRKQHSSFVCRTEVKS
jgi:hypothetical protein